MFKKQLRFYSTALMTLVICSASAYGQTLTHSNGSNNSTLGIGPNSSFVLFSEGSNSLAVDSLEFFIDIPTGSTQTDFGGIAPPPPVTNISGLGIFSGATVSFTPASPAGSAAGGLLSIPNSVNLIDNAPVAEVFFDTTGLSDGDTFIYGVSGDFIDGDARFETVNVLTFFATVEAVPEPSSAGLLLAVGSFVMLRRRRD